MQEEQNKNEIQENILIDWDFPEFEQHERTKKWYIVAIIVMGLFLIYAILTKNILFAIILVLAAFITVVQSFQKPQMIHAAITESGIMVGEKFYPYDELAGFWVIYNPPLAKLLYLDFKNSIKKSLPIALVDVDPVEVRDILSQYLEEDLEREEEELGDRFAKVLKL